MEVKGGLKKLVVLRRCMNAVQEKGVDGSKNGSRKRSGGWGGFD